jgi:signal peptidase I
LNILSEDINRNDNDFNRDAGIIKAVLESGNSVELPAEGYSMFPTFIPGNRVVIKPVPGGTLPQPGNVVVFQKSGVLVMHRLIRIALDDNGNPLFITRGDSGIEPDKPVTRQQLIGIAVTGKGTKKEYPIRSFLPPAWKYILNRRLLSVYIIIRRLGLR